LAYTFNKVIWSEGMFLQPHHFQQQDRYVESLLRRSGSNLRSYAWGISDLSIDRDLLQTGKFAVSVCTGILPDGTPFDLQEEMGQPLVRDLAEGVADKELYLGVPVLRSGGIDVDFERSEDGTSRFLARETEVRDSSSSGGTPVSVQVGEPRFALLLEGEELSSYHCIALTRVIEVRSDRNIVLDGGFIPPCLHCGPTPLAGFLNELEGLLHQRGEALAARVSASGRGGVAEIADFLILMIVNRFQPLVRHLARAQQLHPEALYQALAQVAGELSTFSAGDKRAPQFPDYKHDRLKETYAPVIASLRNSLSMVLEQKAVALPLEDRKYGIRVAGIADRSLLQEAVFVLAVNADVPTEALRKSFPAQIKIGPVEKIRELVNLALPAIDVRPLPVAPRQIPYHAGVTYFELDTSGDYWKDLDKSGGLAFHVAGKFPNLEMAFWAIKK
jgi:type VI secretion system protein ImpJ